MVLHFFEPDKVIMTQYEKFYNFVILGTGVSASYKYMDSRERISLGSFPCGVLIGEIPVFFDMPATYTVETVSYSNVAIVSPKDVKDYLIKNPEIRQDILDEILWNPYDYQR